MNKLLTLVCILAILASCNKKEDKGSFTVNGQLKNAPDQQVYLEQLFFSNQAPEVIDTAEIRDGRFALKGRAKEEGMFRIRLEKEPSGFIFINDVQSLKFEADLKDPSLSGPVFHSKANGILKQFITELNTRSEQMQQASQQANTGNDSAKLAAGQSLQQLSGNYQNYILKFIDTVSDPVVAIFALGYTQQVDQGLLGQSITKLGARFPNHQGVSSVMAQYNSYMAQMKAQQEKAAQQTKRPGVGDQAPDFTMNDPQGKPFSLSQFKGQYVLVDFWASWCGPCRGENPNVVAAYQKFKDKNFTVLGVSLDEDKAGWVKAIEKDKLEWKQISDLKGWNCAAVSLYGFDGIPYNVLLDPNGKIIATELRGEYLHLKLSEVLGK